MIKIKLVYEETIRKFKVPEENKFGKVQSLANEMIQDKFIPTLQYLDEDEDWITISTEADLILCVQTMHNPKVYILHPNNEKINARWTRKSETHTNIEALDEDQDEVKEKVDGGNTESSELQIHNLVEGDCRDKQPITGLIGTDRQCHRAHSSRAEAMAPFDYGCGVSLSWMLYRAQSLINEQDFDDTESSSASTSSEAFGQKLENKVSSKKLKRRLQKLKKKERKVRHNISKLIQTRSQLKRCIAKHTRKKRRIINKIAKLNGDLVDEVGSIPEGNGLDSNIHPYTYHRTRLSSISLGASTILSSSPSLVRLTSVNMDTITTEPAYKYGAQSQMLQDMRFEDITTCKRLLEMDRDVDKATEKVSAVI